MELFDTSIVSAERLTVVFALLLARTLPIVELTPFLGGRAAPRPVKIAVAMMLAVAFAPTLIVEITLERLDALTLALLIGKEALVGLTLGFVTALVFESVRIAGQIIDAARGQTLANAIAPQLPERVSVTADYLYLFAIAFFFAIDGHHLLLAALARSYMLVGPLEFVVLSDAALLELGLHILRFASESIVVGVLFAFPVVAAILLADVALAFVNRAAPQINVFFVGMPLKALLGTAVLLLGFGLLADDVVRHLVEGATNVDLVTRSLGG